jgi:hypothetical protein
MLIFLNKDPGEADFFLGGRVGWGAAGRKVPRKTGRYNGVLKDGRKNQKKAVQRILRGTQERALFSPRGDRGRSCW